MTNREKDIQRYLSGEMTPAEQHALEKAALSDPFLAEALEGLDTLTYAELEADLNDISIGIENQTNLSWHMPAAAASAKKMASSFDMSMHEIASAPAPEKKSDNKPVWMWPLRIAAVLVLLIGGYVLTSILSDTPKQDLALQQQKQETNQETEPVAPAPDTTYRTEEVKKEAPATALKPAGETRKKQPEQKPSPARAEKNDALNAITDTQPLELAETEKLANTNEAPV